MAATPPQLIINNGAFVDDPTAESVYISFEKSKQNFANIWVLLQNQGYEKILLDLNGITTTDKTENEYIAEAIERGNFISGSYGSPFTVEPIGRKPLFYTVTPNGGGFDFRYYRVHKKGQIFGGSGGVFISSDDVSPAGSFLVGNISNPNTADVYIDLGDIGSADVWSAFNVGKPAPNLGDEWTISGLSMVNAIQNGNNRTWVFIGNQRLGIDTGDWGGDDIGNPDYLLATQEDFKLVTNQPTVFPGLFITKSSRNYKSSTLTSGSAVAVLLSPENSTFNINVTGGVGIIKGFNALMDPATYDGMDIYFKNVGAIDLTLKHNDVTVEVPFFFKTEADVVLKTNDILHLKYNVSLNIVELVGISDIPNLPIPFGNLRILKIEGNSNASVIEAGDVVTSSMLNDNIYLAMGEYVSGDVMELASYNAGTVDYTDLS